MYNTPEHKLVSETAAARLLVQHLAGDLEPDDDDMLHDAIEGQTNLIEAINAVSVAIKLDEEFVEGCKRAIEAVQARKRRLEARIDRRKVMIAHAIKSVGLKRAECAAVTWSMRDAAPVLDVIDEALIPSTFFKETTTVALDKSALTAALKDHAAERVRLIGEGVPDEELPDPIPGAMLTGFGETLSPRWK